MLPQKIIEQQQRVFEILQFYDKHRKFPFEKSRINVSLSLGMIEQLKGVDNKSLLIEKMLTKELE